MNYVAYEICMRPRDDMNIQPSDLYRILSPLFCFHFYPWSAVALWFFLLSCKNELSMECTVSVECLSSRLCFFSVCLYAGKTSPLTARDSVQSLCSQHDHCRLFHISVPATIHRHGHFWILTTDQGISRIFLEPRLELCHCTDTTKSILGTLLKHGQSSNLNWS